MSEHPDFKMTDRPPVYATPPAADGQLGIGVIGLHEGRTLLAALGRSAHARAVAGCDLSQDKLDAAGAEMPGLFLTPDYQEILRRSDVQVVAVYTPDHLHAEHICAAFEAGKDVICTKPLVTTMPDARRVLAAGRSTGRKLLVGQSIRFFESFRRQRSAFERGEVGEVEMADAHYTHRMDWFYDKSPWAITDSDWVFMGMSHPVDLVRWYLGHIEEVHAFGSRSALAKRYGAQGFDQYVANLRSADGRLGRVMGNYGVHELPSARNAIELVLYGSGGTSMAQYHDMRYFATRPDGTEVREDALYAGRAYYFNNEVHGMHYGEFANYGEHFTSALIRGEGHQPDLEHGIESFCVMEAIRQSSQTGQPVALAPMLATVGLD